MDAITLSAFGIYLVGMLAIGLWCWKMTRNLSDYILGGAGSIRRSPPCPPGLPT